MTAADTHWAGEPIPVLEMSWGVPRVEAHAVLASTNDRLRELAREGTPPWTVVVAEEQTAGRGREGSPWHSPGGVGIWMSILLPGERGGAPPLTPLLVGLAGCRAIRTIQPDLTPGLKWPNDILLNADKQRTGKVCGILCEGGPGQSTIAGLGMNVRGRSTDFPEDLADRVVTLEEASGGPAPERARVAGVIVRELRRLLESRHRRIDGALAEEVAGLDVLRGRRIASSTGAFGRGAGIAADGALLIREDGGELRRVVAGSVRMVSAP